MCEALAQPDGVIARGGGSPGLSLASATRTQSHTLCPQRERSCATLPSGPRASLNGELGVGMPLAVHLPHAPGSRPLRWVDPVDIARCRIHSLIPHLLLSLASTKSEVEIPTHFFASKQYFKKYDHSYFRPSFT